VNYNRSWTVGPFDETIDYAGTSGLSVAESNGATIVNLGPLTGNDMAPYVGNGDVLFDVFSLASFSGGWTGGNGQYSGNQNFSAHGTIAYVTYEFDPHPVPLPAAVWLLGGGLVGLAGLKRKCR